MFPSTAFSSVKRAHLLREPQRGCRHCPVLPKRISAILQTCSTQHSIVEGMKHESQRMASLWQTKDRRQPPADIQQSRAAFGGPTVARPCPPSTCDAHTFDNWPIQPHVCQPDAAKLLSSQELPEPLCGTRQCAAHRPCRHPLKAIILQPVVVAVHHRVSNVASSICCSCLVHRRGGCSSGKTGQATACLVLLVHVEDDVERLHHEDFVWVDLVLQWVVSTP